MSAEALQPVMLDTNILVYATNEDSPFFAKAKTLRDQALSGVILACISPQVLSEFYSIVTSPKRVAKPLTPKEARESVEDYLLAKSILKLPLRESATKRMVELAEKYQIKEQNIYDAQLVATMLDHGVVRIFTANVKDFAAFKEIEAVNPLEDQDE